MKKIVLILLVCSASAAAFAQPAAQVSAKTEKLRTLLDLTGAGRLGVQMANNMIAVYKKSYPKIMQDFWDDFAKEIKAEDLINMVLPIYEKYYSEDDITQLIEFYKTPLGKKVIEATPKIAQESMLAGQEWGKQLGEKLLNRMKEKGYVAAN